MSDHIFKLPLGFEDTVRLFPLPNFVLFPGIQVPLHIFESRYKEMLEDAIRGDHLIAVATLQTGHEDQYYSRPPISPLICIAEVVWHRRNRNGSYDLLLNAGREAIVESEIEPVRAFRRAKVRLLDEPKTRIDLQSKRFRELLTRIELIDSPLRKLALELDVTEMSAESFINLIAFHLVEGSERKLDLLGTIEPEERLRKLLAHLPAPKRKRPVEFFYSQKFSSN